MKVFRVTYGSRVNGPGVRNVLHLQGCSVKCPGCFNVHTWDPTKGDEFSVGTVADLLLSDVQDGITISGGEPTDQWEELLSLMNVLRVQGQSIVLFTGRSREQLKSMGIWNDLVDRTDIVVSGPYERKNHLDGEPLRGSSNQEVHFHGKYSEKDLKSVPEVEIHIDGDTVTMAGFPTTETRTTLVREIRG